MIKRREGTNLWQSRALIRSLTVYGIAILLSFTILSLFVTLLGYNIPKTLITLITTSFKSAFGFQATIVKTIPLIFTSYAFAIPFMIKSFNIGGWGQMLFGATITATIGISLAQSQLPSYVMIPLLLIAGTIAGGVFAWISGFLRAKYAIDTIISTTLLSFIAWQFLNFIVTTPPFKDPYEFHPMTCLLPKTACLGFWEGIPQSIIPLILAIIFVHILLKRTKLGYEIISIGYNRWAAETYGIKFEKTIMLTYFIGGTFAGLAGSLEIINIHGKLIQGFAKTSGAEYGLFGILTCLIAAGNPSVIPLVAFLMSVLLVGADALQRTMQIPVEVVFLSQALIVLTIVIIRKKFGGGGK